MKSARLYKRRDRGHWPGLTETVQTRLRAILNKRLRNGTQANRGKKCWLRQDYTERHLESSCEVLSGPEAFLISYSPQSYGAGSCKLWINAPAGLISLIPHTFTEAVPRARDTDEQCRTPCPQRWLPLRMGLSLPWAVKQHRLLSPPPEAGSQCGWDQTCGLPAVPQLTYYSDLEVLGSHTALQKTPDTVNCSSRHRKAVTSPGLQTLRWRASEGEDEGQGRLCQHSDANIFWNPQ